MSTLTNFQESIIEVLTDKHGVEESTAIDWVVDAEKEDADLFSDPDTGVSEIATYIVDKHEDNE